MSVTFEEFLKIFPEAKVLDEKPTSQTTDSMWTRGREEMAQLKKTLVATMAETKKHEQLRLVQQAEQKEKLERKPSEEIDPADWGWNGEK